MFPMTVTISNPAQLNAVMAALNVGGIESPKTSPCVGHAVENAKEEAKGKTTSTKKEAARTEAKEEPKAEAQTAAATETAQADAPTYRDAGDAITKLARTKGRDAALAVLSKFGAAKLPDVKPEQFAAVIAACEEEAGA